MKIFKFGGASVKDAQGFKNVGQIIAQNCGQPLIIVVSALGKMTNKMETLLAAYFNNSVDKNSIFETIKKEHEQIVFNLFENVQSPVNQLIASIFEELYKKLQTQASENYDFEYDQIVSVGELLSSVILSEYLNSLKINNEWKDARRLIRTDNNYREGNVDWERTSRKIGQQILPLFEENKQQIIVTQGFIGGTNERFTTTLGREGSDFSAAIFGYATDAQSVTIWKDVEGLLNADPKRFSDTVKLSQIPYTEAIELAYYGASVIHPKTIQPLKKKNIPLYVKSFLHPQNAGSLIDTAKNCKNIPPCFICKPHQVLISLSLRDFSFISQDSIVELFATCSHYGFKINLMQNSALSFSICVDYKKNLEDLVTELQKKYFVKYNLNMELITIRYYHEAAIKKAVGNKKIILEQRNRTMAQFVVPE